MGEVGGVGDGLRLHLDARVLALEVLEQRAEGRRVAPERLVAEHQPEPAGRL